MTEIKETSYSKENYADVIVSIASFENSFNEYKKIHTYQHDELLKQNYELRKQIEEIQQWFINLNLGRKMIWGLAKWISALGGSILVIWAVLKILRDILAE